MRSLMGSWISLWNECYHFPAFLFSVVGIGADWHKKVKCRHNEIKIRNWKGEICNSFLRCLYMFSSIVVSWNFILSELYGFFFIGWVSQDAEYTVQLDLSSSCESDSDGRSTESGIQSGSSDRVKAIHVEKTYVL